VFYVVFFCDGVITSDSLREAGGWTAELIIRLVPLGQRRKRICGGCKAVSLGRYYLPEGRRGDRDGVSGTAFSLAGIGEE